MNYLAHARNFLDRPWAMAGTSLPDWLRVVDKRARVRTDALSALALEGDAAELREGVIAHHDDDQWFHQDASFESITHDVVHELRRLSPDPRFRASTIGHVLVEMLVDAALLERNPRLGSTYYAALERIHPEKLAALARTWTGHALDRFPILFDRFKRARFLLSYTSDDGVCDALSGVLWRIGLPDLPHGVSGVVAKARPSVNAWAKVSL